MPLSAVCFRWTEARPRRSTSATPQSCSRCPRGRVYLSNATSAARFALRACIVNHRTTDEDVAAVIHEVLAAARETA